MYSEGSKPLTIFVTKELVERCDIHILQIFVGLPKRISKDILALMMTASKELAQSLYIRIHKAYLVVLIFPPSFGIGPPA